MDFNHLRQLFLPKGEYFEDDELMSCRVDKLRPIACSNTDAKLIAMAVNVPLAQLAEAVVSTPQRGFVKGRQLDDNVVELETGMLVNSMTTARSAAGIFFDFANAFPSIVHIWIFSVLRQLRVPSSVILLIQALYRDCLGLYALGAWW